MRLCSLIYNERQQFERTHNKNYMQREEERMATESRTVPTTLLSTSMNLSWDQPLSLCPLWSVSFTWSPRMDCEIDTKKHLSGWMDYQKDWYWSGPWVAAAAAAAAGLLASWRLVAERWLPFERWPVVPCNWKQRKDLGRIQMPRRGSGPPGLNGSSR